MNKRKVNAAITAGLCLTMAFGAMPTAAIAEVANDAVPANEAQQPQDKTVYVTYQGMTIAISDSKGNIDMNLVNAAQAHFQSYVDSSKIEIEVAYNSETGEWQVNEVPVEQPAVTRNLSFQSNNGLGQSTYVEGVSDADWYMNVPATWTTPAGKVFAGWALDAEGTQMLDGNKALSEQTGMTGDLTLFAQWADAEQPQGQLNVIFRDAMDDSYSWKWTGAPADGWYFNPEANGTLSHEGYTFAGWTYDKEGQQPVEKDALLTTTGDVTVYAQWKAEEPASNLNITYRDPMDDTYAWTQYGVPADDWFFNPQANGAMQHPGYKFVGWSKDAQNGEIIDPAEVLTSTGDLTLYAQWQEEDSKTNITYIDPMGDYTWKQTIENGQGWYFDLAEDIVSHEGYTFAGWSLDAKGGEILNPQEALTLVGDVCLYAQWTPVEESSHLNIFFRDSMDEDYLWEWAGAPQDAWYFDPEANGALSHEGYTFAGWTYDKEGQQPVAANDLATTTGDVTLYAQWKPADESSHLNVFYRDAMDDSYLWVWTGAPQDNWYFDPSANGAIEHEGYEFAGWTYDKEGQQPVEKDALLTTTGDVTVYAQWTKVEEPATDVHTVTFKDLFNKTVNKVEVKDGEAVATPNAPSFDGYTFHGWSTSDTEYVEYDFATPVTEDITLYASYAKNADPVVPGEDVKPEENGKDDQATSDPQPSLHAGETEDEAKADEQDEKALPQTSDSTPVAAVAGISVAGIIAAVAGFLMKRRTN